MKTKSAKQIIEEIGERQIAGEHFLCPRCGRMMREKLNYNCLSRHANVYVCEMCGLEEALIDATGGTPLPYEAWAVNNMEG